MSLGREINDFLKAYGAVDQIRTNASKRAYYAQKGAGGSNNPSNYPTVQALGAPPPGWSGGSGAPQSQGILPRIGRAIGGALGIGGPSAGSGSPGAPAGTFGSGNMGPGGALNFNGGSTYAAPQYADPADEVAQDVADDGGMNYAEGGPVEGVWEGNEPPITLPPVQTQYTPPDSMPPFDPNAPPQPVSAPAAGAVQAPPTPPAQAPARGALPIAPRKALNDQTRTEAYDPDLDGPTEALPIGRPNGAMPATGAPTDLTAPTVPKNDLEKAIDGGLKFAMDTFHLKGGGAAVGPDPHQEGGSQALMQGVGAATPDMVKAMDQRVNANVPQGPNADQVYSIRRLEAIYRWKSMNGDTAGANKAAFELMQYSAGVASQFGGQAVQQYRSGDMPAAIRSVQAGYNQVPDGRHMDVQGDKATIVDTRTGKPIQQFQFTPEQVFNAAMGLHSRSLYWQLLAQRVSPQAKGSTRTESQQELDRARADYYKARTGQVGKGRAGGGGGGSSAAQDLINKINSVGGPQAAGRPAPSQAAAPPRDDGAGDPDDDENREASSAGGKPFSMDEAQPPPNSVLRGPQSLRLQATPQGAPPLPNPSSPAQPAGDEAPAPTPANTLPPEGVLPGELKIRPHGAPKLVNGVRPFVPGEGVKNPDGSWSSEISLTTGAGEYPDFNGGRATNIPSLWLVNGKPTRVSQDKAVEYAKASGLKFPSFDSTEIADKAAGDREAAWQSTDMSKAGSVAPLWMPEPGAGHPGYNERSSDPDAVPDREVARDGESYVLAAKPTAPRENPYRAFEADAAKIPNRGEASRVRQLLSSKIKEWDAAEKLRVTSEGKDARDKQKADMKGNYDTVLKPVERQKLAKEVGEAFDDAVSRAKVGGKDPTSMKPDELAAAQTAAKPAFDKSIFADAGVDPGRFKTITMDLMTSNPRPDAGTAVRMAHDLMRIDPEDATKRNYTVHGKDVLGNVVLTSPAFGPVHVRPQTYKDMTTIIKSRLAAAAKAGKDDALKAVEGGEERGSQRVLKKAGDLAARAGASVRDAVTTVPATKGPTLMDDVSRAGRGALDIGRGLAGKLPSGDPATIKRAGDDFMSTYSGRR